MARDFVERFSIEFDVYTDPQRASYKAAGWRRPKGLSLRTFAHAGRAVLGGHLQGRTKGDAFQLGGIIVVGKDGEVLFEHADQEAGDHANVDDVVSALP